MADFSLVATYIGDLHDANTDTEIDLVCRTCYEYIMTWRTKLPEGWPGVPAHTVSLDLLNKLATEHTCRK